MPKLLLCTALLMLATGCDSAEPSPTLTRSFVEADVLPGGYAFYGPLDTGDFDGDGDPDLVVSGVSREFGAGRSFEQRLFLNEGDRFVTSDVVPPEIARRAGVSRLGDYDQDGDSDLLFGDISDLRVVRVYPSLGTGFGSGVDILDERTGLVRWLDFDLDGDLDIATISVTGGNECGTALAVHRNDGGSFTALDPVPGAGGAFLEAGDYDGDGDPDVVSGGFVSGCGLPSPITAALFRNDGGAFTATDQELEPVNSDGTVAWLDADGDGDQDLLYTGFCATPGGACAAQGDEIVLLYRNEGSRLTRTTLSLGRIVGVRGVAVADYDGDGDDDFAAFGFTASGEHVASVYTSEGGTFAEVETGLTGVQHGGLAWADYDGDGRLDLFVSGSGSTNTVGDGFVVVLRQDVREVEG